MNKINAQLDDLKYIVLLYANTQPHPVENLRIIKEALDDESFCGVVNMRVELTIGINNLGLEKGKDILSDLNQKDKFLSNFAGYDVSFSPEKDRLRGEYNSAFYEVFGYSIASKCPCTLAKTYVLEEEGFVTTNDSLGKSTWIKERINCLQCDHIQFVAILKDLSKGRYRHLSEIVAKYLKTSDEEVVFWSSEQPLGKIISTYGYQKNEAAFPGYLDGLPCNILVDLLSSDPQEAARLCKCSQCDNFFFRTRIDERSRFCPDDCRNLYNGKQRKTDEGRAKNLDKMKRYRAGLRERKLAKRRAEELRRLTMEGGYTRKRAEEFLNEGDV